MVALAWTAAAPAGAAPYELTLYADDIAAPGETEVRMIMSVARPRAGLGLPRRVGQLLVEIGRGIAPGWEIGLELPAVVAGRTRKLQGVGVEAQYVTDPASADGWYWGFRAGVGRKASVYEDDTALGLEINPILGYRGARYRVVVNPSIEKNVRGEDTAAHFQPAVRLAARTSAGSEVGVEYFSNWGRLRQPLAPSRRDETLYLVWDTPAPFGRLDVGLGKPLRPAMGSADRWVVRLGLQFDID